MEIDAVSLSKRYAGVQALDRVSLRFDPGQIVAVLGVNGAGKTTLLRCLSGLLAPDAGEVRFDGRAFRRDDLETRRRFFFVPDEPLLFWDQTVLRNIAILLRLYQADGPGAEERVLARLRDFDLLPLARALTGTLSRGQRYKAALVALLAADPEVWLFDEPLASGMDPLGLTAFRRLAREAAARGRTIVYTTQMLEVAERFSDRVVILDEGRLRAFERIETLRAQAGGAGLETILAKLHDSDP